MVRLIKAISTVIASVLMLVIVVALAGTSYLFISGTFTGKTSTAFEIIGATRDTITVRSIGTDPIISFTRVTIDGNDAVYRVSKQDSSLVGYWMLEGITNLVTYSEQFGVWSGYCGTGTNIVTDTTDITAPDGTYTAEKWTLPATISCGASTSWGVLQNAPGGLTLGKTYTVSVWAKGASGGESFGLGINDVNGCSSTLTTQWERYTCSKTISSTDRGLQFYSTTANAVYYAWGAQLEETSSPSTYVKTTTAPVTIPTIASDSSGNVNDGTLVGTTWAEGKYGASLSFDGVNDYVNFGDPASGALDPATITVTAWINPKNIGSIQYVVSKDRDCCDVPGQGGYALVIYGGRLRGEIWKNSDTTLLALDGSPILSSRWYHVAMVFTGVNIVLYLDGNQDAISSSIAPDTIQPTSKNLVMGALSLSAPTYYPFNGIIDEVRIYNRALSEQEIKANYNIGSQINAGETATIKVFNQTKGTHTVRICTSSMCNVGYLIVA